MNWGMHLPISPYSLGDASITYSGVGSIVAGAGATMLFLTTYEIISGEPGRNAILMMLGAVFGKSINPAFSNYTNFEVKVNSNQPVNSGDIRMLVKYKRYIDYKHLSDDQKGLFKLWYYGN